MTNIGRAFPTFKQDSRDFLWIVVSLAVLAAALAGPALGQRAIGNLTVMTYNVNEGTDFLQVLRATNATEFLLGVGTS